MLGGKNVVLGVTGGIAAYKAAEVVSRLVKLNAAVDVIMTKNATEFVAPLTFETLSRRRVVTDTFERPESREIEHISLAQKASLFIVAPATANIMAKLACGIADDMLSTTLLATKAQVLLAPAMNTGMWEAAATRENAERLLKRGVRFVGPESGQLACGDTGAGRMSEPEDIVRAACDILLNKRDMDGLSVLVTSGPTRESLDPVRFMSNRSSGKMGRAIAECALSRGADVTFVTGPAAVPPPEGARVISIETTGELLDAMLSLCDSQDIIIQAAAPADYRFESVHGDKLKKRSGQPLTLTLVENPDVAKAVGERKRKGQTLVGFAAETSDLLENARKKLASKNLDLLVANNVALPGAGFEVDTNIAALVSRSGQRELPLMSKKALAGIILDEVMRMRPESE